MKQHPTDCLSRALDITPINQVTDMSPAAIEGATNDDAAVLHDASFESGTDLSVDYDTARRCLQHLITKGSQAVDEAMELAASSQHPRAYEVAGALINNVSNVADKLLGMQEKIRKIQESDASEAPAGGGDTNNYMFVGSTTELTKLLQEKLSPKN